MRKFLNSMLALMLAIGCMFALIACVDYTVPEGYKLYKNDDIAFAYPEDWTESNGSIVMLTNPSGVGNNITVVYEAKTNAYNNMTVDTFNEQMAPILNSAGISVSDVTVEKKSTNLLRVVQISYTANASGQTMTQTIYITSVGQYTYSITVTETTPDPELVTTVFETLRAA